MDMNEYVESIQRQVAAVAEAGGEDARALAERLMAPLDATIRMALLDLLAKAAEEITCDLAPGSVEVRLRGRDPEFVVTLPPVDAPGDEQAFPAPAAVDTGQAAGDTDMARINLRMPDQLKVRIEQAAATEGISVNAWLVRAAAAALERPQGGRPERSSPARTEGRAPRSSQRYKGWAR